MIEGTIVCDHRDQLSAQDVKAPCASRRGENIMAANVSMEEVMRALRRRAAQAGWKRWIIPAAGRRSGWLCPSCYERAKAS